MSGYTRSLRKDIKTMHEWGLIKEAIEEITQLAKEKGMKKVNRICFNLGKDDHLTPEALDLCFKTLSKGTMTEKAELEIKATEGYGLILMSIEGIE